MTAPRPLSPDHARHDSLLIAAAADRGASAQDTAAAAAQLSACAACRDLLADLVALEAAIPMATTAARPRDFSLTPGDAERLRPTGPRRWIRVIGSSRDAVTRPLAIGFTTLGLAGLLLTAAPGLLPMAGSTAVLSSVGNSVQRMNATAMPESDDGDLFSGGEGVDTAGGPIASDKADGGEAGAPGAPGAPVDELAVRDDASGLSTLVVLAGILTIMGLGLFALRWTARRFGD